MGNILDEKNKIYFLHNPKTAGTSIREAFDHPGNTSHSKKVKDRCENWFVFTFVRNPWDRLYSAYLYNVIMGEQQDWEERERWKYEEYKDSFKNFLLGFLSNTSPTEINQHFHPQHHWYENENINFVGRFERVEKDFQKVCDKFGLNKKLPEENKSEDREDYREIYTEEMKEEVYKIYKKDIEDLNYTFD